MKKHRFLIKEPILEGELTVTDTRVAHQLKDVLKIAPGEEIVIFDGLGQEANALVAGFKKHAVILTVTDLKKHPQTGRNVTLYVAIIKHDGFDDIARAATEIGVSRIVPIVTSRTIKRSVNEPRLNLIIAEAAEQCGRSVVPVLAPVTNFEDALKEVKDKNLAAIFCDFGDAKLSPKDFASQSAALFIGPEGGFTPEENNLAKQAGCAIRSLGANVLRTPTAAAAALYLAVNS